jgi:hypothetical protein
MMELNTSFTWTSKGIHEVWQENLTLGRPPLLLRCPPTSSALGGLRGNARQLFLPIEHFDWKSLDGLTAGSYCKEELRLEDGAKWFQQKIDSSLFFLIKAINKTQL